MIKVVTEQNASPLAIYIKREDLVKVPEHIRRSVKYLGLNEEQFQDYPKSYKIFLVTELRAVAANEVICITDVKGLEEIWTMEETELEFEELHDYPDDALTRILKDCNMSLGHIKIGHIKFD